MDEKSEQDDKKYQAGILLSPLRCGVTQSPTKFLIHIMFYLECPFLSHSLCIVIFIMSKRNKIIS